MTNVEALKALYVALGGDADDVANVSTIVGVLNKIAAKYDGESDAIVNPDAIANITAVLDNIIPDPTLIEKTITENGEYAASADNADGYSSVSVDVEPNLTTKAITANGTYTATTDDADGYSEVTVNVPAPTLTGFSDVTITEINPYALVYYENRDPTTIKCMRQGGQETPPGCTVVGWITGTF